MALDVEERELFMEGLQQEQRLFFQGILLYDTEREVRLRKKIRKTKNSMSFRVGKKVTAPVRAWKKFKKNVKLKKRALCDKLKRLKNKIKRKLHSTAKKQTNRKEEQEKG